MGWNGPPPARDESLIRPTSPCPPRVRQFLPPPPPPHQRVEESSQQTEPVDNTGSMIVGGLIGMAIGCAMASSGDMVSGGDV